MKVLNKGDYYGEKRIFFDYQQILVSNISTSPKEAPMHYHENAYFSYFLKGILKETTKKESHYCSEGTLLYHHSQDPHENKNEDIVHNINIELTNDYYNKYGINPDNLKGTTIIKNPSLIFIFDQIHKEIMINDKASRLAIEGLVLQCFGILERISGELLTPKWVKRIKDYLHGETGFLNLETTAKEVGLNPSYLSQAFPKYFKSSLGDYVRKIRLQKATAL